MSSLQYIEAPNIEKAKYPSIFLAGGITNCPDWQSEVVGYFVDSPIPITIFNPRRADFPIGNPNAAAEQIAWEYHRIREADALVFWFSRGSDNPIVLFEYGSAMEHTLDQFLLVGIDGQEYSRRADVLIQSELRLGNEFIKSISFNLIDLGYAIRGWLRKYAEKEIS